MPTFSEPKKVLIIFETSRPDETEEMSFSEKFRAARLEKKLTQQQVADELKIDRSAIAHYENGKSKPHFDNVRKICEILDLTYEDLFDD